MLCLIVSRSATGGLGGAHGKLTDTNEVNKIHPPLNRWHRAVMTRPARRVLWFLEHNTLTWQMTHQNTKTNISVKRVHLCLFIPPQHPNGSNKSKLSNCIANTCLLYKLKILKPGLRIDLAKTTTEPPYAGGNNRLSPIGKSPSIKINSKTN